MKLKFPKTNFTRSRLLSLIPLLGLPLLSLSLLGLPLNAVAGSVKSSFKPSTTVANSCVINSTSNLSFGGYIPSSAAPLQTSGQISLNCTKGASVSVVPASGGSALNGSGGTLNYGIYIDSGMTQLWGSGAWANYNNNVSEGTFFKYSTTLSGHLSATQLQAAIPNFNPNTAYAYYYSYGSTSVYYGYLGQSSKTISGSTQSMYLNANQVVNTQGSEVWVTNDPSTIPAYSNGGNTLPWTLILPGNSQLSNNVYTFSSGAAAIALSGTSTSVKQAMNMTYYGKIPPNQDVAPGTYTDTVMVQVNF